MHFAYIDEAGNTGQRLDDPKEAPVHLIGALFVPEDKIAPSLVTLAASRP
jgi:hypothetical protein